LISAGLVLFGRSQNKDVPESGNAAVAAGALGLIVAFLGFLGIILFT